MFFEGPSFFFSSPLSLSPRVALIDAQAGACCSPPPQEVDRWYHCVISADVRARERRRVAPEVEVEVEREKEKRRGV